jgi:hypothetical protein
MFYAESVISIYPHPSSVRPGSANLPSADKKQSREEIPLRITEEDSISTYLGTIAIKPNCLLRAGRGMV